MTSVDGVVQWDEQSFGKECNLVKILEDNVPKRIETIDNELKIMRVKQDTLTLERMKLDAAWSGLKEFNSHL